MFAPTYIKMRMHWEDKKSLQAILHTLVNNDLRKIQQSENTKYKAVMICTKQQQSKNVKKQQSGPIPTLPGQKWSAQNTTSWEYKIQSSNDLHKIQQAKKSILKIQNTTMQWYAQNKEKWEY